MGIMVATACRGKSLVWNTSLVYRRRQFSRMVPVRIRTTDAHAMRKEVRFRRKSSP